MSVGSSGNNSYGTGGYQLVEGTHRGKGRGQHYHENQTGPHHKGGRGGGTRGGFKKNFNRDRDAFQYNEGKRYDNY